MWESCENDCRWRHQNTSQGTELRKIEIKLKDKDYFDFLSISIDQELSVEDNLKNIIKYHLIIYRNKNKIKNKKLFS